ncbi:MAG TPA: hypothetical protein VIV40_27090 [Kofleriaceae bacterium]
MRVIAILLLICGCNLRLAVVREDGQPLDRAAAKEDVFIALSGPLTAKDYTFQVIDERGTILSLDPPQCRALFNELPCRHRGDGALVQLMPFADAEPDDEGVMHFIIQVAPADYSFDATSLKATFAVEAWPSS